MSRFSLFSGYHRGEMYRLLLKKEEGAWGDLVSTCPDVFELAKFGGRLLVKFQLI